MSATRRRQLLGINLDQGRLRRALMVHHGQMHAQPGVGLRPDTPVASGQLPSTSIRSRRSGISKAQRETWERLWPELGLLALPQSPRGTPVDTRAWFGRDAPVVLEIGSGSGTSTLAMAKAEPHVDVIAVDVYRRGLAQLLCAIDKVGSDGINIRLILGNAVDVLQHLIAPDSLCGVRVFFPDPWPKARHHKRACYSRPPWP